MILIFAETHFWDSAPRVDSHYLAREMARRGHSILYLSAPVSPLHWLGPGGWRRAWARIARYGGSGRPVEPNLRCLCPFTFAPVNARFPLDSDWLLRRSLDWTAPPLRRTMRRLGFGRPHALIVQSLFFAPLARSLAGAPLIYRMTDDFEAFPGMPRALRRAEPPLLRAAALATASSHRLAERCRRLGARRVELLPHGVDLAKYRNIDMDFARRPKRAAYVGALDSWFYAEMAAEAARRLPDWRFEIAGPAGPAADLAPLRSLPNARILGPIAHDRVPDFLGQARIGLIPFRRTALIESVHPLKLYEYLAAGLNVVAARWDELERMNAPLRMADTPAGFADAAAEAALEPCNAAGRAYAAEADWSRRAARLEALIESLL